MGEGRFQRPVSLSAHLITNLGKSPSLLTFGKAKLV